MMEIQNPIYEDFEFEQIYHLFTRVSGNEYLFKNEANFRFFLEKISKYLLPYLDVYAYCLAPQRFSLLVCFKAQKEIFRNLHLSEIEMNKEQVHKFLMKPISNLLNSYAKSYNKVYNRKGALFVDFVKRERLDDEDRLLSIFQYIHLIPVQNKLCNDIKEWKFSSYKSYLELDKPSNIKRQFMLSFFEDKQHFLQFHKNTKVP